MADSNQPQSESESKAPTTIPLRFTSSNQVYKSFMPFFTHGGLFVPTTKAYELGEGVTLIIKLPDDEEKFKLLGSVAWISPAGVSGDKKQGIGIEFAAGKGASMRQRIERLLGDRLGSDDPTYTM